MKILGLIILFILSGCATAYMNDPPPEGYKEVRCTYVDGQGRHGLPLTNYVKGAVKIAKLSTYGDMAGVTAKCDSTSEGTVSVELK